MPTLPVTPHFEVGYTERPDGDTNYIDESRGRGHRRGSPSSAYAADVADGFPGSDDDVGVGPDKLDIDVVDLTSELRASVVCTNGAFDCRLHVVPARDRQELFTDRHGRLLAGRVRAVVQLVRRPGC